jgi:hypothetical protein
VAINGKTKAASFNADDRETVIEMGRINKNRKTVISILFE